jgi:hypothetical protein
MPQLTDKVAKIAVQGLFNGQEDENIFYVQVAETITSAILEEIAGRVATWVADHQLAALSNLYQHVRIVVTDQTTDPGLQFVNTDNAGLSGAQTSQSMPNNSTFAIHRKTGMSGKASKSRVYWPTIVLAFLSAPNTMDPTTANNLVNDLETLRLALETAGISTYVYGYISRVLDHLPRTAGVFVPVVGHSFTDLTLDSQRRRLPGRGD